MNNMNDDPDDFDYDEFVEREFGDSKSTGLPMVWKVTAAVLLGLMALALLSNIMALLE